MVSTVWPDDPERAVAKAREPRVPNLHLRAGLVPERAMSVRCEYAKETSNACREKATESVHTRSQRRDYCSRHGAEVRGDIEARRPRRLGRLVDWF